MNKLLLTGFAMVAAAGAAQASIQQPTLQVVAGAKALSTVEKVAVTGQTCGCPSTPAPPSKPGKNKPGKDKSAKPGYGFGDKNREHYGPPGQGFTPTNTWRSHAAGDGLTPRGRPLPPRAFR